MVQIYDELVEYQPGSLDPGFNPNVTGGGGIVLAIGYKLAS